MSATPRTQRLLEDHECLLALQKMSAIFSFEASGAPPDRYTFIFQGRGIARDSGLQAPIRFIQEHRCDVRLPFSYPDRPPDIRWISSNYHPNISFGGFINLREIGLPWEKEIHLDTLCERLWDVSRLAYINLERATNFTAAHWFASQTELKLPVDERPLLTGPHSNDTTSSEGANVIQYRRRGAPAGTMEQRLERESEADVFYIGDDTRPPIEFAVPPPPPRRRPATGDDGDILYIGDE